MKLKCISPKLNHVVFSETGEPHRVRVGEVFEVTKDTYPAAWEGLVVALDSKGQASEKVAVTNPEKGATKTAAK